VDRGVAVYGRADRWREDRGGGRRGWGGRDELGFGEGMSLGHGEIKRKKIASPGRGYEAVGASVFDFDPAGA
jgi:hypothetical protein